MKRRVLFRVTNFGSYELSTYFEHPKYGIWQYDWSIKIEHLSRLERRCNNGGRMGSDNELESISHIPIGTKTNSRINVRDFFCFAILFARSCYTWKDNWRSNWSSREIDSSSYRYTSFEFSSNTAHVRETESDRRVRGREKTRFRIFLPRVPRSFFRRTEAPFLSLMYYHYHHHH